MYDCSIEYKNTLRLAHYSCIDRHQAGKTFTETNNHSILQSTAAIQGYTKMNAKILALMALLSLAALAAGYPTNDDGHDRTNMDALKLINKIAREQLFKQELKEIAEAERGMYNAMSIVSHA